MGPSTFTIRRVPAILRVQQPLELVELLQEILVACEDDDSSLLADGPEQRARHNRLVCVKGRAATISLRGFSAQRYRTSAELKTRRLVSTIPCR